MEGLGHISAKYGEIDYVNLELEDGEYKMTLRN
jgi:hypothetical protein